MGIMTNGLTSDILVTKQSGRVRPREETIMATVNFAANGVATILVVYYLHGEHYETLFSKKEQSLIRLRSCKIKKRRKTV